MRKIISDSILFRGMTEDEKKKCLSSLHAREKTFKKNTVIMHAGETTDLMGMVVSGSVTIETNDVWGNRTILSHVGAGQFFAETYALLPDEVMLVDVTANEDSEILFMNAGEILNGSSSDSWSEKLIKNILMISLHKNLNLSGRSFHTSSKSCRARLLSYLSSVSLKKHSTEFTIPFNRQQLADYLNLERTNMSKELSKMQREGIIEFHKNHFKLIR